MLYPVGRLDRESEGLIFLTNDGEFTLRLTHPRYGVRKTYRTTVEGSLVVSTSAWASVEPSPAGGSRTNGAGEGNRTLV